ncbi:hypothetical protein Bca4012_097558 [Brassica carinata]
MCIWSRTCAKSSASLRKHLTHAPVLVLARPGVSSMVYSDAFGTGLGCVLIQKRQMVTYASRKLRTHEVNY